MTSLDQYFTLMNTLAKRYGDWISIGCNGMYWCGPVTSLILRVLITCSKGFRRARLSFLEHSFVFSMVIQFMIPKYQVNHFLSLTCCCAQNTL